VERAKPAEPETYLLYDAEPRFPSFLPDARTTKAETKKRAMSLANSAGFLGSWCPEP